MPTLTATYFHPLGCAARSVHPITSHNSDRGYLLTSWSLYRATPSDLPTSQQAPPARGQGELGERELDRPCAPKSARGETNTIRPSNSERGDALGVQHTYISANDDKPLSRVSPVARPHLHDQDQVLPTFQAEEARIPPDFRWAAGRSGHRAGVAVLLLASSSCLSNRGTDPHQFRQMALAAQWGLRGVGICVGGVQRPSIGRRNTAAFAICEESQACRER